jgi:hypothetical protein
MSQEDWGTVEYDLQQPGAEQKAALRTAKPSVRGGTQVRRAARTHRIASSAAARPD